MMYKQIDDYTIEFNGEHYGHGIWVGNRFGTGIFREHCLNHYDKPVTEYLQLGGFHGIRRQYLIKNDNWRMVVEGIVINIR